MKQCWLILFCCTTILVLIGGSNISAATFVVTNSNDSGAGSLRQAIVDANAMSGYDVITFAIPGAGVKTITPQTDLPWITERITINGFSQGGTHYKGSPLIELDGSLNSGGAGLILYDHGNSVIRGLIINRFGVGLGLTSGSCGHIIKSNYIGTDPTGTTALGNNYGMNILSCPNNQIGVGGKNLISGNNIGVYVEQSQGNVFEGNYVGIDITGTQVVGNLLSGIAIAHSTYTTIGLGNVISGNQTGIHLEDANYTVVFGNYLCTDKTGVVPLGDAQAGLFIRNSSSNLIGGVSPGQGNVISCYNTKVFVESGTGNSIRGNLMYSLNTGYLGIDLAPTGVTSNDFRDFDTGPNNLQNSPTISDAVHNGATTIIFGTLSSSYNTQFVIDFYSSPTCINNFGVGDGKTYLGSLNVATPFRQSFVNFQTSLPVSVPVGHVVTATATTTASNNTSEFSSCFEVHYPE